MSEGEDMPPTGEFLLYITEDGKSRVECRFENETLWLSQALMGELFDRDVRTINEHLKNLYEEEELSASATIRKFRIVRMEGTREVKREIEHYNLEAILAVGFRVKSPRGTQFRRWANTRLQEYLVKGFTMDDLRLKEGGGGRYFEELLQRIRDIRSSEKVFWRKVLDIFATSIDYSPEAVTSKDFFAKVQNQLHWAAHGHTAAEIIHQRADASLPNMGVTNFPGGKLLKRDTEIAKNYLSEEEVNLLNRIVTAYLELAEIQAMNRVPMTMQDWVERLHQFLTMTGRDLLTHAGEISRDQALEKAHQEYERLRTHELAEPSEAEKQFIANAEKELKALEQKQKERPE
jgi:hypothetical protein